MYLLDSNTYIQAKNLYYQMNFCPAYWDWLDQQFAIKAVGSVTNVYEELSHGNDDLSNWVKARQSDFIPTTSEEIQSAMSEVADYVVALPNKNQRNLELFLAKADPWLIACAMADGHIIVTQEEKVDAQSKKIKIPNVCEHFGVQCITTFDLLTKLSAKFIL